MQDTLLIATGKAPGNSDELVKINDTIRKWSAEYGLTVIGGIQWCEGPGCANLAVRLEAPDEGFATAFESWANSLTMAFGIAKWSNTRDVPPTVDTCTLEWAVA